MAQSLTASATQAASQRAVTTRAARFEDYQGIAALQARNGLTTRPYSAWSALWTENPAAINSESRFPLGWVLEDSTREIRGYLGNVPLAYTFRGRLIRAATPFSWVVDPAYRFHSLDLQRRFISQTDVDLFVYTTINAVTEKLLRAFSFTRLATGTWDTAGFWITGYLGFARSVVRSRSLPLPLAFPVSAGLYVYDGFRTSPKSAPSFNLSTRFDSRFDRFWEELKAENALSLLAVRDRETLDWHFRRALARNDLWILTASRGNRIIGCALFDRHDNPDLQLKRIRFADFQALRGSEHLLGSALDWAVARCRREGIHVLENVGCWLDRFQIPGTRAPHRRKLQSWLFYYKTRDPEFHRELCDANLWAPSAYDGDASI